MRGQVVPSRREGVGFLAEAVRHGHGGAEFPHVVFLSLLVQLGNLNCTLKAVGVDKEKIITIIKTINCLKEGRMF